ncbi:MAG: hypothetical protein CMF38_00375 [Legionellaceae bacterium]|nr:hypothetical protein [Legionellaceae bacterium]HCA89012.1 hypothetical protein [Legionellales bacterium]|tara:strand:- start:80 stop:679 length:600 start_codon:yes stop_codon:yes gene_type:complete
MAQWHGIDWLIVIIMTLSVITGLVRGLIKELLALGIWALAFWVAYHYAALLVPFLKNYIGDATIQQVVAYTVMVVLVLFAGGLVSLPLNMVLKKAGLSSIDRLLGVLFGFIRATFLIGFLIMILSLSPLIYQNYIKNSTLCEYFEPVSFWLKNWMPDVVEKIQQMDLYPASKKLDHKPKISPTTKNLNVNRYEDWLAFD